MNWYVLHVRPKSEKKAEKQLLSLGINAYCPLRNEIKIWSDRKKRVEVPVLPSMVLVKIGEEEINKVFQSPSVTRYMFWLGKRALVSQLEIDILKEYLDSSSKFSNNKVPKFKVGDNFSVSSFNNERGIVRKISNNNIWIFLKSLGHIVKLKVA